MGFHAGRPLYVLRAGGDDTEEEEQKEEKGRLRNHHSGFQVSLVLKPQTPFRRG